MSNTKQTAVIKDSKTGKVIRILKGCTESQIQAVVSCLSKHFSLNIVRN